VACLTTSFTFFVREVLENLPWKSPLKASQTALPSPRSKADA